MKAFPQFPKTKLAISDREKELFSHNYRENREGQGFFKIVSEMESWMHRVVAKCGRGTTALELGAGTLNHVPYETGLSAYDIVEPWTTLYDQKAHLKKVRKAYADISQIRGEQKYDRIFSIAVLEHILDLPSLIAQSALHLQSYGQFQAAIPSEGGMLWGLSWRMTTGLMFRLKYKASYSRFMRYEHVNTAEEIVSVVRYFFEHVSIRRFPFPYLHASFYTYLEASHPKLDVCRQYLSSRVD